MRVLIVPDKFKGTLTARQAVACIARGWKRVRPHDTLDLLPMSDGGDGFGEVMSTLLGARARTVQTVDAAHRLIRARWWWEPKSRTAIIESARIIGLAMLPPQRLHPFQLDTFGLGNVLTAAARLRPRFCLIGIGGSATNDGGFGMARALGWRFLTKSGRDIRAWPELAACDRIISTDRRLDLGRAIVAIDVHNPLLGFNGCTRVYGPQKGLRPRDFKKAEAALRRLSNVMNRQLGRSQADIGGAGAAGGLGFGLMTFLDAIPMPGFKIWAQAAELGKRLRGVHLVITGEGRLDDQSLMGKGVGTLLALCERCGVPCLALCGQSALPPTARKRFAGIHALTELTSVSRARQDAAVWLTKAAELAAGDF